MYKHICYDLNKSNAYTYITDLLLTDIGKETSVLC